MNEVNKKLIEAYESSGLSFPELEKITGIPKSSLQRYITGGFNGIPLPRLRKIASALNVSASYIMGWDNSNSKNAIRIPVLGTVAAGIPIDAIEDIIDWEEIPENLARTGEFFGLQIKGNSMEPRIMEGDTVIVRKQPDVDSGEIAIVLVNGDEATCKKVTKHPSGGLTISALNSNVFEPKFYTLQEIRSLPVVIIGKVVELRGKL